MTKFASLIFILLITACVGSQSKYDKAMYSNPIIAMDLSDPDVIRVGKDYYMTISSFNMMPGLPIYHSRDLVNWQIIGHAVQAQPPAIFTYRGRQISELDYDAPRPSKGVWAPSFEYHDDQFWIYWGDPDAGVYMVKADKPEGPWSRPLLVHKAKGWIDPTVVWDKKNKKAYLAHAFAKSRVGYSSVIDVMELSYDGTRVMGESVRVYDAFNPKKFPADKQHKIIEGPKFDKFGDWFYILAPAGGVESGWQVAMRSRHPLGPYEIRTIGETGNTNINGPHQGALIESHKGDWWFLHFQSAGTLGRIARLEPASWVDGWPITGIDENGNGIGNPVATYRYPHKPVPLSIETSDEFENASLGLQWQWPANPQPDWFKIQEGKLFLPALFRAEQALQSVPHVLNQLFPGPNFDATLKLDHQSKSTRASFLTLGRRCFDIGVEGLGSKKRVSVQFDGEALAEQTIVTDGPVWLRVNSKGDIPLPLKRIPNIVESTKTVFEEGGVAHRFLDVDRWENGKLYATFSYSLDGKKFISLGERYVLRSGWWSGVRLGIAVRQTKPVDHGFALFDSITFDIRP